MPKKYDLKGKKFYRLKVIADAGSDDNHRLWLCKCDCGNMITVKGSYLLSGEVRSCGCLKAEQDHKNLREQYDNKRVNGVVMPLFTDKPRKTSSTGFRGVYKYYTRKSRQLRYKAWITVNGKKYYKGGFKTPEEAYYNGRLMLEEKYLPKKSENEKDN
ncbi:hypothetical protein [Heyndrickxia coagulans]|uniref:hypothetical protein n=1 Tax=Heyndrickxia coagulans TaxID=1398 RepID=UPI0014511274|nr:hypothetical protein [Heyndrickxia coagulans]MED4492989.1 hypothetical protein [Heyndrickxia coagulans]MED4536332.1 hypothetical protein [Heyndrickxia coagulans]QJE31797.1 hypothetical protein HHU11_03515 [Heyndrickxia coagulans]